MKIVKRLILLLVLLAFFCGILSLLAYFLLPVALRSWCRKRGVEYNYSKCSLRLSGKLTINNFDLQKGDAFSFSAERFALSSSLFPCLIGRWNIKDLQIDNGNLLLRETGQFRKLHLSQISFDLYQLAPTQSGSLKLLGKIEEIDLLQHGFWQGGDLSGELVFTLSKELLLEHLQGKLAVSEVALSQEGVSLGTINGKASFAMRQDAPDNWQIIPESGEPEALNRVQVKVDEREVIDIIVKSGTWEQAGDDRKTSLQLLAYKLDSEPFLSLFSRQTAIWVEGGLNYLNVDLRSSGSDTASLLENAQGSLAFDIERLSLKNSPFIEIFSKRTALDLTKFLHFNSGSAIVKIDNAACRLITTTPFQGTHPVVTANGNASFDGSIKMKLEMGFSPEVEELLMTKRYFLPFANICRRDKEYLMLPGSLTIKGTLQSPSVDLTELLKVSAKVGVQNLFEDAAGRIGIRLRRPSKENSKKE